VYAIAGRASSAAGTRAPRPPPTPYRVTTLRTVLRV